MNLPIMCSKKPNRIFGSSFVLPCDKFENKDKININKVTTAIPKSAVIEIKKAWSHVLEQTRYDENPVFGFDGTTYDFFIHDSDRGRMFLGSTWSPESGSPKMLVQLGELLVEYAKRDPIERIEMLRTIVLKAFEIQNHQFKK